MAVSRSTSNIRRWLGAQINALVSGNVDAHIVRGAQGLLGGTKLVQTGYTTGSATLSNSVYQLDITLPTSVVPGRCIGVLLPVRRQGRYGSSVSASTVGSNQDYTAGASITFPNSTTMRLTKDSSFGTSRIVWQVIERSEG